MTPGDGLPPQDSAEKSLGDIVTDVSEKASLLVREEIELAKAEVTQKFTSLGRGAGIAAAAAVFLVFAITMFFHGLAWLIDDIFDWNSIWPGVDRVAMPCRIAFSSSGCRMNVGTSACRASGSTSRTTSRRSS